MKNTYRALITMSCPLLASVLCCGQLHAADPYRWCAVDSGGGTWGTWGPIQVEGEGNGWIGFLRIPTG